MRTIMGEIIIKGLKIYGYHGVNAEEKENGQFFEIDLKAKINMDTACISDRIGDTVSYSAIIKTVKRIMSAGRDNLLERAAYRIAEGVLLEYEAVESVEIKLKKPDAPIKACFDYVAVSLSFERSELFGEDEAADYTLEEKD